jgi:hypothetical protein
MADDKSKSGAPPKPSFYSEAGKMAAADASKPAGSNTPAGQSGEKVKNVEVLLEVIQKMDKLEQDQDGKAMIQAMADAAKKYLDKLKGVSDKPGPAGMPPTGEAGSGGGMGTPAAGGADMGAGGGMAAA